MPFETNFRKPEKIVKRIPTISILFILMTISSFQYNLLSKETLTSTFSINFKYLFHFHNTFKSTVLFVCMLAPLHFAAFLIFLK